MLEPRIITKTNVTGDSNNRLEPTILNERGITSKFSHIHLDTVQFDNMSLSDVLAVLAPQVKAADPEHVGINFMFASSSDIASVVIRMKSPLTNAPVREVIDAIVAGADKPIAYSIQPYAIEFFPKPDRAMLPAPPQIHIQAKFIEVDSDSSVTALFQLHETNTVVPSAKTLTGVLDEKTFRQTVNSLNERDRATVLGEGQVITLSGREAQFQVQDAKTVPIGWKTNAALARELVTTNLLSGPMLDVIPTVLPDGRISLNATPEVIDYIGYEDPSKYLDAPDRLANLPLPQKRVRTTTTSAIVLDGQSLVVGIPYDETYVEKSITHSDDGSELKIARNKTRNRQMLVFITVNVVDAAGNRLHGLRKAP